MNCINCNATMTEIDHDFYRCPVCGDELDLNYPSKEEWEAWKAEDVAHDDTTAQDTTP